MLIITEKYFENAVCKIGIFDSTIKPFVAPINADSIVEAPQNRHVHLQHFSLFYHVDARNMHSMLGVAGGFPHKDPVMRKLFSWLNAYTLMHI